MVAKKTTAIVKAASEETLAALAQQFPTEPGFSSVSFPRLGLVSQDITEEVGTGRNKTIKVITPAGEFYLEKETGDEEDVLDAKGKKTGTKKVWEREELGDGIEGVIAFQRKQLKYFDKDTETYTSSTVYDDDNEVVKLFCAGAQVDEGTPAALKAKYPGVTKAGKPKSDLEDNRIVYVLYEGEFYQMNLRGTSMYAYMTYCRKTQPGPNAVVTTFGSEYKESGKINWNQMTFAAGRSINDEEAEQIREFIKEMIEVTQVRKGISAQKAKVDAEFDAYGKGGDDVEESAADAMSDAPRGGPRRLGRGRG